MHGMVERGLDESVATAKVVRDERVIDAGRFGNGPEGQPTKSL